MIQPKSVPNPLSFHGQPAEKTSTPSLGITAPLQFLTPFNPAKQYTKKQLKPEPTQKELQFRIDLDKISLKDAALKIELLKQSEWDLDKFSEHELKVIIALLMKYTDLAKVASSFPAMPLLKGNLNSDKAESIRTLANILKTSHFTLDQIHWDQAIEIDKGAQFIIRSCLQHVIDLDIIDSNEFHKVFKLVKAHPSMVKVFNDASVITVRGTLNDDKKGQEGILFLKLCFQNPPKGMQIVNLLNLIINPKAIKRAKFDDLLDITKEWVHVNTLDQFEIHAGQQAQLNMRSLLHAPVDASIIDERHTWISSETILKEANSPKTLLEPNRHYDKYKSDIKIKFEKSTSVSAYEYRGESEDVLSGYAESLIMGTVVGAIAGMAVAKSSKDHHHSYEDRGVLAAFKVKAKTFIVGAVMDGHNGKDAAQYVKENLALALKARLKSKDLNIQEQIIFAIIQSCNDLHLKFMESHPENLSGCTLAGCLLFDKYLYVFNLGDSRVLGYLEDSEYYAFAYTVDMTASSLRAIKEIVLRGGIITIDSVSGIRAMDFNATQGAIESFGSIGDAERWYLNHVPDVVATSLPKSGWILISSDGIFDALSSNEVAAILAIPGNNTKSPEEIAKAIIFEAAKIISAGDDKTVIVLKCSNS